VLFRSEGYELALKQIDAVRHFIIAKSEYNENLDMGFIWMESPSSVANIFDFPNQIRHVTENKTTPMLLEIDI